MEKSWLDPSRYLRQIYVEESCAELQYTKEILDRANLPFEIIPDGANPEGFSSGYEEGLSAGKKVLVLGQNRGAFLKPCPATREYRCCDYYVLNIGMNCPMDCVYCILQAYLNNPWMSFYVNVDQMFDEMNTFLDANPNENYRIGTGEFTDSLALDRITNLSSKLIEFMGQKRNSVIELKTKSGVVDNLKGLPHNGNAIIAWSLNSSHVMEREEYRVATFDERLEAARKCADWGYRLAFHFDPIVVHDGWEEDYSQTIEKLFETVPSEQIVWISIGALRFLPDLKKIGGKRFPQTKMFFQEFIEGLDGKSRYFRYERAAMYEKIYSALKKKADNNTCIYFCMESDEIWQQVMGFKPEDRGGLPQMLNNAVF